MIMNLLFFQPRTVKNKFSQLICLSYLIGNCISLRHKYRSIELNTDWDIDLFAICLNRTGKTETK